MPRDARYQGSSRYTREIAIPYGAFRGARTAAWLEWVKRILHFRGRVELVVARRRRGAAAAASTAARYPAGETWISAEEEDESTPSSSSGNLLFAQLATSRRPLLN